MGVINVFFSEIFGLSMQLWRKILISGKDKKKNEYRAAVFTNTALALKGNPVATYSLISKEATKALEDLNQSIK